MTGPERSLKIRSRAVQSTLPYSKPPSKQASKSGPRSSIPVSADQDAKDYTLGTDIHFPSTAEERERYRTLSGKKIGEHQWRVYDVTRSIPRGKVTHYGVLAKILKSHARAVGNALRNNPFAPLVPCHRIISASGFIGGFSGDWGIPDAPQSTGGKQGGGLVKGDGKLLEKKLKMLADEGVGFDTRGYLLGRESNIWHGDSSD